MISTRISLLYYSITDTSTGGHYIIKDFSSYSPPSACKNSSFSLTTPINSNSICIIDEL